MPIDFSCRSCQRALRVPDAAAGKQARCPDCGQLQEVPAGGSETLSGGSFPGWDKDRFATGVSNSGAQDTGNPFQASQSLQPERDASRESRNLDLRHLMRQAHDRVRGPARSLLICGVLMILGNLSSMVMNLLVLQKVIDFQPVEQPLPQEMVFQEFGQLSSIVMSLASIVAGGFIVIGALRMERLQSYGMALSAAILTALPCVSCCCFYELPLGIWALVVLADSNVRAAFDRKEML